MTILDDINAWAARLDQHPHPALLECGPLVFDALRAASDPAPTLGGMPVPGGVPVRVLPSMDTGAWRFLNADGAVMWEGTL